MSARRALVTGAMVLALAAGASACSGEEGPVDDGTYSSLRAGAPAILADLDIALVSIDQPAAATPEVVRDALIAQRLPALNHPVGPVDGVALDTEKVAGLLGLAGNTDAPNGDEGRYAVLSFDSVEAAVVFARSDPTVFEAADSEADRAAYFSGNLIGYYAPGGDDDATDRFEAALDALAGS